MRERAILQFQTVMRMVGSSHRLRGKEREGFYAEVQRAQRRGEARGGAVGLHAGKNRERFLDCVGRPFHRSEMERKGVGLLRSE